MANNQGFLTGTGGAASAYTVAATDIGSGVLAQQMQNVYWDVSTSTWKTVDTTNRLPVTTPSIATNAATAPASGELIMGKDSGGLAKAIAVDSAGQIIISNPSSGEASGGLTDTQLRATPVAVSLSGSATSAAQTTTNDTLTSLDGKLTTKTVNSVVSLNTIATLTGAGAGNTGVTVVATVAAVQLASNDANQFVTIQNSNGSAGVLFYGFSAGVNATTGFELKLGELINIPVDNTNRVWLFSTAGAIAKIGWV
jgi:hypothetical protein